MATTQRATRDRKAVKCVPPSPFSCSGVAPAMLDWMMSLSVGQSAEEGEREFQALRVLRAPQWKVLGKPPSRPSATHVMSIPQAPATGPRSRAVPRLSRLRDLG